MEKHLRIKIQGRVQGVFFRASTLEKALEFGVKGFIRNEPNGSVYIEAEGDENGLQEFLEWCRHGPELASVEKIEFDSTDELEKFSSFKIE